MEGDFRYLCSNQNVYCGYFDVWWHLFLFKFLHLRLFFNRFNDFGDDGGPAAVELAPKLDTIHRYLTSKIGDGVPTIDVRL